MLYREAGQFKSTYAADQQIFPILQDRIAIGALLVVALVVVPLIGKRVPAAPAHRAAKPPTHRQKGC